MDNLQRVLQLSAKLYQFLEAGTSVEQRDDFIKEIDRQLDERGKALKQLLDEGFQIDSQHKVHAMLIELDKGIRDRMDNVMNAVKSDMKTLQAAKKNEKQYLNPYSSVQVMDGMYYDKKK